MQKAWRSLSCLLTMCALFGDGIPARAQTALSFDGIDDLLLIGGTPLQVPWTAEFWVKREEAIDNSAVLLGDAVTALKLEQYENTRQVGFTRYGVKDYTLNYVAPTGTWVHLAFVGSTDTRLYANGVLQGIDPAIIPLPLRQIGNDIENRYSNHARGTVDEVRIWSLARNQNEIQANMNRSLTGSEPGLVAYWRFDEAAGPVAYDSSGHDRSAFLTNGPAWVPPAAPFITEQNQSPALPSQLDAVSVSIRLSSGAPYQLTWSKNGQVISVTNSSVTASNITLTATVPAPLSVGRLVVTAQVSNAVGTAFAFFIFDVRSITNSGGGVFGFAGSPSTLVMSRGTPGVLSAASPAYSTQVVVTPCGTIGRAPGLFSRWYRLLSYNDGFASVGAEVNGSDPIIGIYTGSILNPAAFDLIACNRAPGPGSKQCRVQFRAKQYEQYFMVVDTTNSLNMEVTYGYDPPISHAASRPDQTFELRSAVAPQLVYSLQTSATLRAWATLLSTNFPTNGFWRFVDTNAALVKQRFYRIVPGP